MVDGYVVKVLFNVIYLLKLYELIWFKKKFFFPASWVFSDDNIINFVLVDIAFLFFLPASPSFPLKFWGICLQQTLSPLSLPPVSISPPTHIFLSYPPLLPPTSRPTDQLIIIVSSENPIGQILPGRSQETELCGIHSCGQLTIKDGKMGGEL